MTIRDQLSVLSELHLIKKEHELSYDELSRAMWDIVGLTGSALNKMMNRDYLPRHTETAIAKWLEVKGRAKYPLE